MQKPVYTIGYAAFPDIRDMMRLLHELGVDVVVDVRSIPFSKTYTDYNQQILKDACLDNRIHYRHYKNEFGARQTDRAYTTDGQVDFERFAQSPQFLDGKQKMLNSISAGYTPCLLCAEKDPIVCHRAILIGRNLHEAGAEVKHIMAEGEIQTQKDIEKRLLDMFFPHRDQIPMWDEPMSEEDFRREAYKIQNYKVGYRVEVFS